MLSKIFTASRKPFKDAWPASGRRWHPPGVQFLNLFLETLHCPHAPHLHGRGQLALLDGKLARQYAVFADRSNGANSLFTRATALRISASNGGACVTSASERRFHSSMPLRVYMRLSGACILYLEPCRSSR